MATAKMSPASLHPTQGDIPIRLQASFASFPPIQYRVASAPILVSPAERPSFIICNCVEMVAYVPNWFFSTCSFIGFILCMIPLPWHIEAWNMGTCMFMVWTGMSCLNDFINSVVWNSDAIDRAPVWCDISTKLMIGSGLAIPAASLCINRRLYQIASVQTVMKTHAQKRRDVLIDLAIGLGLPLLQMILHVVVQSHRYVLVEEIGCIPFIWDTALAYVLVSAPPIIIGVISAGYSIGTIRELAIRRAQFKEFLSTNRNLSSSRYFRLMGLAGAALLLTVPLGIITMCLNLAAGPVSPYVNWNYAHDGFHIIEQIPSVVWRNNESFAARFELTRYTVVLCAVIFFAFFGFADEAKRHYRLAYTSVAKRVGLSTGSTSTTGTWSSNGKNPDSTCQNHSAVLPVVITHQTEKRRDSIVSFSSRMSLPDYGGALADVKKETFSPMATSVGSISKDSLSRLTVDLESAPLPRLPEASFDTNAPPRYEPDVTRAV